LDDWHEEDKEMCPLLHAEQGTPIHPYRHSEADEESQIRAIREMC